VTITDQGIVPSTVYVAVNGGVTWVNAGDNLHTATGNGGGAPAFDTGGLSHGATNTVTFTSPGTFSYTSSADCLQGGHTQGFNCGPFSVVVGNTLPTSPQAGALTAPNPNTTVTIDDANGFQPKQITIKVGQSITWLNKGTQVHTVVSDLDALTGKTLLPAIDSGGLSGNQSFSFAFVQPGTLTYHSSTDMVWSNSSKYGFAIPTYTFTGSVVVVP